MLVRTGWTIFKRRSFLYSHSGEFKSARNVFRSIIIAVVIGFLIAFIFVGAYNQNPLSWFSGLFQHSFNKPSLASETVTQYSLYMMAGLSFAIVFRAGIFNIGVPGQVWIGASIATFYGVNVTSNMLPSGLNLFFILVLAMIAGALLAGIAGVLKAFLNINEVISTIMLNWLAWFLMKYAFETGKGLSMNGTTTPIDNSVFLGTLTGMGLEFVIPLVIALVLMLVVWFLIKKTTLGFSLNLIGKNPEAAKYAGINVRSKIVTSMLISGGIGGILGAFWLMDQGGVNFTIDNLPQIGFDGIALSLVALNNPLGIGVIAWLWAIVQFGSIMVAPAYGLPSTLGSLVFGVVIYCTAIAALFLHFHIFQFSFNAWNLWRSKKHKRQFKRERKGIYGSLRSWLKHDHQYNRQRVNLWLAYQQWKFTHDGQRLLALLNLKAWPDNSHYQVIHLPQTNKTIMIKNKDDVKAAFETLTQLKPTVLTSLQTSGKTQLESVQNNFWRWILTKYLAVNHRWTARNIIIVTKSEIKQAEHSSKLLIKKLIRDVNLHAREEASADIGMIRLHWRAITLLAQQATTEWKQQKLPGVYHRYITSRLEKTGENVNDLITATNDNVSRKHEIKAQWKQQHRSGWKVPVLVEPNAYSIALAELNDGYQQQKKALMQAWSKRQLFSFLNIKLKNYCYFYYAQLLLWSTHFHAKHKLKLAHKYQHLELKLIKLPPLPGAIRNRHEYRQQQQQIQYWYEQQKQQLSTTKNRLVKTKSAGEPPASDLKGSLSVTFDSLTKLTEYYHQLKQALKISWKLAKLVPAKIVFKTYGEYKEHLIQAQHEYEKVFNKLDQEELATRKSLKRKFWQEIKTYWQQWGKHRRTE